MGNKLELIEKIGINRCIQVNGKGCTVVSVGEHGSIVEYHTGGREEIKFGTLIDPMTAPIFLMSWA